MTSPPPRLRLALPRPLLLLLAILASLPAAAADPYVISAILGSEPEYRGARMLVEELNDAGGIDGHPIELVTHSDHYDLKEGLALAERVAGDGRSLAVIGHAWSDIAQAAGEVYRRHGLPAITPFATNDGVTANNPWYFRTTVKDGFQGKMLAAYAHHILRVEAVTVIQGDGGYGASLGETFARELERQGGGPARRITVATAAGGDRLAERIHEALGGLVAEPPQGLLFLADNGHAMAEMIGYLRRKGIQNPILASDEAASGVFLKAIHDAADGRRLSRDLLVSTPFIFDIGGQPAQEFRSRFRARYGGEPDYQSAYAYDTMKVVAEAIHRAGIEPSPPDLTAARAALRRALAGIDSPRTAVAGVTGAIHFDAEGDSRRTISVGKIVGGTIVSALTQLRELSADAPPPAPGAEEPASVVNVDGLRLHPVDVIYTGIRHRRLDRLDFERRTFDAEFDLWLRSRQPLDTGYLRFANAVGEPKVEELRREEEVNGRISYQRLKVAGSFKMDTVAGVNPLKEHALPIQYHHASHDSSHLLLVKDFMADEQETLAGYRRERVLDPSFDWELTAVSLFREGLERSSLGDAHFAAEGLLSLNLSQFNAVVWIDESGPQLADIFSRPWQWLLFTLSSALALLPPLLGRRLRERLARHLLTAQYLAVMVALTAFKTLLVEYHVQLEWLTIPVTRHLLQGMDVLMWLFSAYFLNEGVARLVWAALEHKSGQPVPVLIRRLASLAIYLAAAFGILSYVLHQEITNLLATSGLAAMILGLAVQSNLANIFSGMAVSFEKPFRIGDRIRVGFEGGPVVGRVEDMTWRSTRLSTDRGSTVSIPNGVIAATHVDNLGAADGPAPGELRIALPRRHEPQRVIARLGAAAAAVEGVVAAAVDVVSLDLERVEYRVVFEHRRERPDELANAVWQGLWGALEGLEGLERESAGEEALSPSAPAAAAP